jgi:hypothetical protein
MASPEKAKGKSKKGKGKRAIEPRRAPRARREAGKRGNEANWGEVSSGEEPRRPGWLYKRTQFRRVSSLQSQVSSEQTKPIDRRARYPVFHYSIIPAFPPNADCAKQTQSRVGRRQGQVLYGKGITRDSSGQRLRKNKANPPIADCGFWPRNGVRGDEIADSRTLPSRRARAGCTNKPRRP